MSKLNVKVVDMEPQMQEAAKKVRAIIIHPFHIVNL